MSCLCTEFGLMRRNSSRPRTCTTLTSSASLSRDWRVIMAVTSKRFSSSYVEVTENCFVRLPRRGQAVFWPRGQGPLHLPLNRHAQLETRALTRTAPNLAIRLLSRVHPALPKRRFDSIHSRVYAGEMSHPLRTSVDDFVKGLKSFERDLITKELVRQYVDTMRLSPEALKPYTFFRDDYYTRNLIFKDDLFEVMTICWKPGQKTVIHTHNGQLGWMSVAQGEVAVHNYRYVSCNAPENQNVIGIDCLGGATRIELERLRTEECSVRGEIVTVDKLQTIHQIENSDTAKSGCI